MKNKILEAKIKKAKSLIRSYKSYDEKRFGEHGDLDVEWVYQNIIDGKCEYCGNASWGKLGCDRIDNDKPHTKDNCICACTRCNTVRGNKFTVEEMKIIGKAIRKIEKIRNKNKKQKDYQRYTGREKVAKKVAKINIETNEVVKIYNKIIDASIDGYERSCVGKACSHYNGRSDVYKGFRWNFID